MNTIQMNRKYTKAIDNRTNYSMDAVIEWWNRMMMGDAKIEGTKITFRHACMNGSIAIYTRNVW